MCLGDALMASRLTSEDTAQTALLPAATSGMCAVFCPSLMQQLSKHADSSCGMMLAPEARSAGTAAELGTARSSARPPSALLLMLPLARSSSLAVEGVSGLVSCCTAGGLTFPPSGLQVTKRSLQCWLASHVIEALQLSACSRSMQYAAEEYCKPGTSLPVACNRHVWLGWRRERSPCRQIQVFERWQRDQLGESAASAHVSIADGCRPSTCRQLD